MKRISDTVTSVFHIAIKDGRPAACLSRDDAIVWSDVFGLGWRFGISYNPNEWFARVRLHLDHNHSHTENGQAVVSISLNDSTDKGAQAFKERVTTITDFGHGPPALLGSWPPSDLSLHPYVSITVTTKTRISQPVADPLSPATLALRQSMESGHLVDTKFYVFSAKHPGNTAGKPRVVYVNSNSIGLALPKSTSGAQQSMGLAPTFLVNMTGDHHIKGDSVLHEYEYECDSDLDDDEEEEEAEADSDSDIEHQHPVPDEFQATSSSVPHIPSKPPAPASSTHRNAYGVTEDDIPADPPAYSVSTCRMILVKGVAYKTWVSYIFFRYTGMVSFLPLKSAQGSSSGLPSVPSHVPRCSPKSMYRLADSLRDERLKELAFRAIKEGLSKENIVEETFTWFTAQYPSISKYEVEKVSELRKSPEVSSALKLQMKAVSRGEKPWAQDALIAIMDKLNPSV